MTGQHEHDWKPIPELFGRYTCACGVTGYRNSRGAIVAHKNQRVLTVEPTVRQRVRGRIGPVASHIEEDFGGGDDE